MLTPQTEAWRGAEEVASPDLIGYLVRRGQLRHAHQHGSLDFAAKHVHPPQPGQTQTEANNFSNSCAEVAAGLDSWHGSEGPLSNPRLGFCLQYPVPPGHQSTMPTISPHDLKVLDDLRKEYRVVFAGKLEPQKWPELHRPLMERVAALGSRTFSSYTVDSSAVNAPWKAEVKEQARKLVEIAKRNSYRNESTWRMSCEPLVLARLSSEVVWFVLLRLESSGGRN